MHGLGIDSSDDGLDSKVVGWPEGGEGIMQGTGGYMVATSFGSGGLETLKSQITTDICILA